MRYSALMTFHCYGTMQVVLRCFLVALLGFLVWESVKFEPLTHCAQIVYSNHLATVEYHFSTLSLFHDFGQSQSKYFGHNHANTQSQSKIPKSFKRIEVVLSQLYLLG